MLADWAYGRPDPTMLKAAGFSGVIRYLTKTGSKRLTYPELVSYQIAELDVHAVYEDSAGRANAGYAAGAEDARRALVQATALGWDPVAGGCIYFAVDFDATGEKLYNVVAYFRGVASVIAARHVGVYGSALVVSTVWANGFARYRWQTDAWSHGYVGACDIHQRGQTTVDGIHVDVNEVLSDDTGSWFDMDSDAIRNIVKEEISAAIPSIATAVADGVWTQHPDPDVTPQYRQLSDFGHTLSAALPDQVGTVGVAVAAARDEIQKAVADIRERFQTLLTALTPND